jgi:hypothetical protein
VENGDVIIYRAKEARVSFNLASCRGQEAR